MNLVLAHCWKEWRAQRGLLLAYSFLVFSSLCLGLSLAPTHYWFDDGFGVHAITWFMAAGVIGVVAFAAPGLVRGEFTGREDQFLRRLPGALWPAFGGKLLFLLLVSLALPLLGLLLGEGYVSLRGFGWDSFYSWKWDGTVEWQWPGLMLVSGGVLCCAPWVWAVGCWMPGGRMALGGSILFILLLGVGVFALLRQSPGLEHTLAWQPWCLGVMPLGIVVAALSLGLGRRGGGPWRSARYGLAATAVGLLAPATWLGNEVWRYHHPDPQELSRLEVYGLSPDGRYALAVGSRSQHHGYLPFRIDLGSGDATQLGGIHTWVSPELEPPGFAGLHGRQQFWRWYEEHEHRVFDLATGEWCGVPVADPRAWPELPDELRAGVAADRRGSARLRAPGGDRVWFDDGELCREHEGTVHRRERPMPDSRSVWPAGHGFLMREGANGTLFDMDGRRLLRSVRSAFVVGESVVFLPCNASTGRWRQCERGQEARRCAALAGCEVLGLFDDERLLCTPLAQRRVERPPLFLYRPDDGAVETIELAEGARPGFVSVISPLGLSSSLIPRDPAGRIWLLCADRKRDVLALLDCGDLAVRRWGSRAGGRRWRLLDWPDANTARIQNGRQIIRLELHNGAETVVFPRQWR
ncbi:MAG: hypothetical protein NXI31_24265 [bacterium]|nr:hypothetical protein [bacterium]